MTSQEHADAVFRLRELIERTRRQWSLAVRCNRMDRAAIVSKRWDRLEARLVDLLS